MKGGYEVLRFFVISSSLASSFLIKLYTWYKWGLLSYHWKKRSDPHHFFQQHFSRLSLHDILWHHIASSQEPFFETLYRFLFFFFLDIVVMGLIPQAKGPLSLVGVFFYFHVEFDNAWMNSR